MVSGAPDLLNTAPYNTFGTTVEPIFKSLFSWLSTSKLILPANVTSGLWLITTTVPGCGIMTGPFGAAKAAVAMEAPSAVKTNARFNTLHFIIILLDLDNSLIYIYKLYF